MTLRTLVRFMLVASIALIALAIPYGGAQTGRLAPAERPLAARHPSSDVQTAAPIRPVASASPARVARPVFGHRVTSDGGQQLFFLQPELQFQKTSYPSGRSLMVLQAEDDVVEVGIARESGFTIRRGGRTVSFYPSDSAETDFDRARAVLAGSKAVRRFRTLVAELDDSRHAGVIGLQLADAIVGLLDGDVGAPAKFGRRLRAQATAGATRVSDGTSSCWYTYEQNVTQAEEDREQCLNGFSIWNPLRAGCYFEWTIRVEGDWAEYLSCSSIGGLLRE